MDAAAIVGLLADADRRRCWAAVEMGATSSDQVVAATGLPASGVAKALGRLASGGLVSSGPDGLVTASGAFGAAALQALSRPESDEHAAQPDDIRRVLRAFVVDGRISQIPAQGSKRTVLLDWLGQDFEPGTRYTEAMVNLILGKRHADTAALRRYLVDEQILDRANGEYWRSGGTVVVGAVRVTADHYDVLGVRPTATRDEIRLAYRRLARDNHPDARGESSAARMAQINAAWHVLSDPARRAVYDATLRVADAKSAPNSGSGLGGPPRPSPRAEAVAPEAPVPSRFPWRFLLVIATIGIAFVIVNAALSKPDQPAPPDNLLGPGSCVTIETNGDAREVLCNGANDGVVAELIGSDDICPSGTERHRDRQGMGIACVRMGGSG